MRSHTKQRSPSSTLRNQATPSAARGVPISHRIISHDRAALEAEIACQRHIEWTQPRRDDRGTAWVAYGTSFAE